MNGLFREAVVACAVRLRMIPRGALEMDAGSRVRIENVH
jgi:hypothetical protein